MGWYPGKKPEILETSGIFKSREKKTRGRVPGKLARDFRYL